MNGVDSETQDCAALKPERQIMNKIRVLVFGATGTGKTSLCNELAEVSWPINNGAIGITDTSHTYPPFQANDYTIELIDTVGLHESNHGTVPADKAVVELIELLEKARDGFSLLIQVTRASRITKEHDDDYNFFVEKMTQCKIPVILAATGCENEEPMASWGEKNREHFKRFNYKEIVSTCFASGGRLEEIFKPLRRQSREELVRSILEHALPEPSKLYGDGTNSSFSEALTRIWNEFVELAGLPEKYRRQVNESAYALMKRIGVPKKIADAAIKHIPDLMGELGNKTPIPYGGQILVMSPYH